MYKYPPHLQLNTDGQRSIILQPTRLPVGLDSRSASLEVVSLKNRPVYSALSYTWGRNAASKPILLNGSDFHILLNISWRSDNCEIQIFVLCGLTQYILNQSQIPLMKEVYSVGSRVLVWLGESDASIDECAHHIASPYTQLEGEDQIIYRLLSYRGIVLKPWWSRIWVIQEFIFARDEPLFLCGHYK
jgi:hypothetical protein